MTCRADDGAEAVRKKRRKLQKIACTASSTIEGFDVKHQLHYLSVHFMDSGEFGKARLLREITEAFLDSKIKVPGFEGFTSQCPAVPEEDLLKVPGAKVAMGSVDALKLEVLVREGASVIIKPDEAKYFRSIPDQYCEEFEVLYKQHGEKYAQCLASIIQPATGTFAAADAGAERETDAGAGADAAAAPAPEEFESLAKLNEADAIEEKVVSEVTGVTILKGRSRSLYLMLDGDDAPQEKILPRKVQLGGYGSGTYVKLDDPTPGVAYKMNKGDASLVQFDESSLKPESSNIEVWSLYKMIVQVEKAKRLPKVNVSFLKVTRKADAESLDSFDVEVQVKMKYQPIGAGSGAKITCKNFFKEYVGEKGLDASKFIQPVFRFRYEQVGTNLKVQKPYVITSVPLKLKLKKPIKAQQVQNLE
eukprot:Skav203801  [mRNA]  locus=scaffold206:687751:698389:+ [translate_table: standard]